MISYLIEHSPETNEWQRHAACLRYDPDWWFLEKGSANKKNQTAVKICKTECPVISKCLEYIQKLEQKQPQLGIYAGMSEYQRTRAGFRPRADGRRPSQYLS